MASDDLPRIVRTLMWVEYPFGTHLSQSSTPGRSSALARDDDNTLVAHGTLFSAETAIKVGAAVCVSVGIVGGIVATKATPHVKNKFNNLTWRLNRMSEDTVEAVTQQASLEQSDMGIEKPRSECPRLYVA